MVYLRLYKSVQISIDRVYVMCYTYKLPSIGCSLSINIASINIASINIAIINIASINIASINIASINIANC